MATTTRQLNLTLPAPLVDAAQETATGKGETITAVVRRALERYAGVRVPTRRPGRPKKILDNPENT